MTLTWGASPDTVNASTEGGKDLPQRRRGRRENLRVQAGERSSRDLLRGLLPAPMLTMLFTRLS
jgi:hypothetical protein